MYRAITNLKVQATKNPGPEPERGWHFLEQDLNRSVGGDYIYVGYQVRDSAPEERLMELNFYSALGPQQGPQVGWECWDSTDINKSAGGDYIYMEWKKGYWNLPIINIMFLPTSESSPPNIGGWTHVGVDLNRGAGGLYIWAYYSRTVPPPSRA